MIVVGDSWYVVQTQVNAEAKAARNLVHQGFEIYLPRYLKRRSHARKIEKVVVNCCIGSSVDTKTTSGITCSSGSGCSGSRSGHGCCSLT